MKHPTLPLACVLLLLSCSNSPVDTEQEPVREPTVLEKRLADASQSFGLKLFRQMSSTAATENQFISPVSVALALGMTLNGANTGTYDSMKATLELNGLTQDEINQSYQSLMALLLATDPAVTMDIANSVWYRSNFSVEQTFIDALTAWYSARVQGIDFSAASAAPTINAWVSDATHARITEIVPDPIPPDAVMYLINALYFKGTWTLQFDPTLTRDLTFTKQDGSQITTPFMTMEAPVLAGFAQDGTTVLELSYGAGHFRMTFLLPPTSTTVDAFIAGLTDAAWEAYISSLQEQELMIRVPKFRMEYERSLKEDLGAMGMGIAFNPAGADFTRINPAGQLFISEVKHKTFVQVDEEGTEAAAVTSVEVSLTSMPQYISFDRPFVFAIRDTNSGTVVFIGKMHVPEW